jgi:hypothetical protein
MNGNGVLMQMINAFDLFEYLTVVRSLKLQAFIGWYSII